MINIKAIFNSSNLLISIYVASLVLLIFISGFYYKHTNNIILSTAQVEHSYKVNLELEQLVSYLKDAETGQRGFIITRDSSLLEPSIGARENVNRSLQTLKILTAENLKQQNNLDSLYQLINLRFFTLVSTLEYLAESASDTTQFNLNFYKGKVYMDQIRQHVDKMIRLETIYLQEQQKKYNKEILFTPIFTLGLLSFSILIILFSYFKINRDLVMLKKANTNLIITTASFKQAEQIGDFSSWQWDLLSNNLIFSDNQYRLLGCEPQSFASNFDNYLDFVHPEDRNKVIEGRKQITNEGKLTAYFYRIIRKDGEVRYFKTIGKVLTDAKGKKTLICINSDITEQHLGTLSLAERNRELERSNKDLASFNHMASHDLQEPLRKIQTYISRLSDKEMALMSETGKEYFSRIQLSVNRMRILIDDLLQFSRTNKIDKDFERADLNLLLENAQQDLSQVIEEKNAVITAVHLPALHVIPFQIQQLFLNLLGNSLKYSKPDVSPVIKISCVKIPASSEPVLSSSGKKEFFKISISDNGLGFEQQYAESIFILFNRLHPIADYPGTGIGLSICKKIIENHNGIITAEGNPGTGSTFHIFLPA